MLKPSYYEYSVWKWAQSAQFYKLPYNHLHFGLISHISILTWPLAALSQSSLVQCFHHLKYRLVWADLRSRHSSKLLYPALHESLRSQISRAFIQDAIYDTTSLPFSSDSSENEWFQDARPKNVEWNIKKEKITPHSRADIIDLCWGWCSPKENPTFPGHCDLPLCWSKNILVFSPLFVLNYLTLYCSPR